MPYQAALIDKIMLSKVSVPVYPLGGLFANKLAVIGYELQVIQQ